MKGINIFLRVWNDPFFHEPDPISDRLNFQKDEPDPISDHLAFQKYEPDPISDHFTFQKN